MAQPAVAATQSDPGYFVSFYSGRNLTGTEIPVDYKVVDVCVNVPQRPKSVLNIAPVNVEIYFNPDCAKGRPGQTGDLYYIVGSIHSGDFNGWGVASYRLRSELG
ncbi:hypothetical protein [Actinocrispum sp. NPDC049592]|uniref:hypothetical protein n=1 Tax=Actinocrispum sp. NPDC049592 TaxID=3154835 RepID=UPI00342246E9